MNHHDQLVTTLCLDLELATDTWKIRFTDDGHTKQSPSYEADHRRTA
jgi:hypothetical protein